MLSGRLRRVGNSLGEDELRVAHTSLNSLLDYRSCLYADSSVKGLVIVILLSFPIIP